MNDKFNSKSSNKKDKKKLNYDEDNWNDIDDNKQSFTKKNKKLNTINKNKKENFEILKKKRNKSTNKTEIEYDTKRKKLIGFCPKLDDLKNDDFKNIKNISKESIIPKINNKEYDNKCIKVNKNISSNNNKDNIEKSSSEEEFISLLQIDKKISQIQQKSSSNIIKKNLIKDILNSKILNPYQKEELNKLILKIKNMDIKNIVKKEKKLDIVFDLDNTCISTFP